MNYTHSQQWSFVEGLAVSTDSLKKFIKDNKVTLDALDSEGQTLLHFCAQEGRTDLCKFLLDGGHCTMNCLDNGGSSPLFSAASRAHLELVKLFVETYKANTQLQNNRLQSPLHCLVKNPPHESVDLMKEVFDMLARNNELDSQSEGGQTALHEASARGREPYVRLLLQYQADPNISERRGETALHYAVRSGKANVVKMLLLAEADKSITSEHGTALEVATVDMKLPPTDPLVSLLEQDSASLKSSQVVVNIHCSGRVPAQTSLGRTLSYTTSEPSASPPPLTSQLSLPQAQRAPASRSPRRPMASPGGSMAQKGPSAVSQAPGSAVSRISLRPDCTAAPQTCQLLANQLYNIGCGMMRHVAVHEGRHLNNKYENVFTGEELLKYLISSGAASDVASALSIGNQLMEMGFFTHVYRAHNFQNRALFYKYSVDDPKKLKDLRPLSSHIPVGDSQMQPIPEDDMKELRKFLAFAWAPYSDFKRFSSLTGLHSKDVLFMETQSDVSRPANFMAFDEATHTFWISVRGTQQKSDLLTNAQFLNTDIMDGAGHSGFVKSGKYVFKKFMQVFEEHRSKLVCGGYTTHFNITGHSLGGATASVLTILVNQFFRENQELSQYMNLKCITFGSPPTFTSAPALNKTALQLCTTYVNQDDPVPALDLKGLHVPGRVYQLVNFSELPGDVIRYRMNPPEHSPLVPKLYMLSYGFKFHSLSGGRASYSAVIDRLRFEYHHYQIGHLGKVGPAHRMLPWNTRIQYIVSRVTVDKQPAGVAVMQTKARTTVGKTTRVIAILPSELETFAIALSVHHGLSVNSVELGKKKFAKAQQPQRVPYTSLKFNQVVPYTYVVDPETQRTKRKKKAALGGAGAGAAIGAGIGIIGGPIGIPIGAAVGAAIGAATASRVRK